MSIQDADSQADSRAWLRTERTGRVLRLIAGGAWIVRDAARLDKLLGDLRLDDAPEAVIDGSAVTQLDSAGGWLLVRTKRALEKAGKRVSSFTLPEVYSPLIDTIEKEHTAPPVVMERRHGLFPLLERIGRATVHAGQPGLPHAGLSRPRHGGDRRGDRCAAQQSARRRPDPSGRGDRHQRAAHRRPAAFLIGVVLAYQGADQLKRFGAEIFTINLLGVGVLREIGGLITAIIVAGRSGSAFTAQIGTMRVNEEIDAMQTIGLNTVDALVLPRIIGLVIALPLLTFYADIMGLIGGAVMCYFDLGITIPGLHAPAAARRSASTPCWSG